MATTLAGRRPDPSAAALVAELVPPPHFISASFDSYVPDRSHPSQAAARAAVQEFSRIAVGGKRLAQGRGIYLDGGFGVGKTHLLAALAHAGRGAAAYGTFVEITALVGALGFAEARDALAAFRLVCVDEFELDDVGDTLLMARLMRELRARGVFLAVTSNTPPGVLGEGRFAAEDFRREIQGLASAFDVVTINGDDYRHRGEAVFPPAARDDEVIGSATGSTATCDDWTELVDDLLHVHPSRYGAYVGEVRVVGLLRVRPLSDQSRALRVVALVDRLYDRDVRIVASGVSLGAIFGDDMLAGGYRKKYLRALSRLAAMLSQEGPARPEGADE